VCTAASVTQIELAERLKTDQGNIVPGRVYPHCCPAYCTPLFRQRIDRANADLRMSDDRKEEEAPAPPVEHKQDPQGEPGNAVPFVPYIDDTNMRPIFVRRRPSSAALDANNQVFPPLPLATRGRTVQYVDFGFTSAREFWSELVLPSHERFKADPSRANAMIASLVAWHVQDWIWHDQRPGEDTRNSKDYPLFQAKLFNDCPELAWIRDVADAGKHRGLGRPTLEVREVANTWPLNTTPSTIKLDDGTVHDLADVLSRVIEYWRTRYFP
jgi:hypothetical protein